MLVFDRGRTRHELGMPVARAACFVCRSRMGEAFEVKYINTLHADRIARLYLNCPVD